MTLRYSCIQRRFKSGLALVAVTLSAGLFSMAAGAEVTAPAAGKSPVIDKIRAGGELRAGIAIAPPWLGQDPSDGSYFGPAHEIGKRVSEALGVELTIVPSGWDTIIAGLQADQFELALAPLFATDKRKKVVDFVTYTEAGTCYAVLDSNDKVNTLEDMNDPSVTIGTWSGTGTEHGIRERYTKARINSVVQAVGGSHRLDDLFAKRIDAAPFDAPNAFVIVEEHANVKILPGGPAHCVNNSDIPFPVGMAFNYGDAELKNFLEAVVIDMKSDIDAAIVRYSAARYMKQ
ncbi:MAG: substrate-binding periplasmic protein [Gammaproteobacteria bacterium]